MRKLTHTPAKKPLIDIYFILLHDHFQIYAKFKQIAICDMKKNIQLTFLRVCCNNINLNLR